MSGKTIRVALALVRRGDRWLVARRRVETHLGGMWEFPGGKCEPGEQPEHAAIRELWEECATRATVCQKMSSMHWDYPDRTVELHPILCEWASGEAVPVESLECRWVTLAELNRLTFPAPNAQIVQELSQLYENE